MPRLIAGTMSSKPGAGQFAGEALKEVGDRHFEHIGDLLQPAGADAVYALRIKNMQAALPIAD